MESVFLKFVKVPFGNNRKTLMYLTTHRCIPSDSECDTVELFFVVCWEGISCVDNNRIQQIDTNSWFYRIGRNGCTQI